MVNHLWAFAPHHLLWYGSMHSAFSTSLAVRRFPELHCLGLEALGNLPLLS